MTDNRKRTRLWEWVRTCTVTVAVVVAVGLIVYYGLEAISELIP